MGELLEFLDWFRAAGLGWRYLFSPEYRREVHEKWKNEKWYYAAWDILCGLAGIAFGLLVIYLIWSLFLRK